jgi:hypothetical protein
MINLLVFSGFCFFNKILVFIFFKKIPVFIFFKNLLVYRSIFLVFVFFKIFKKNKLNRLVFGELTKPVRTSFVDFCKNQPIFIDIV